MKRKREEEEEAQRVATAAEEARRKAKEAEDRRMFVKRRRDEHDLAVTVERKKLKLGARVTQLGSSSAHGDARVIALGKVDVHLKLADGKIHVNSDTQLRNLVVHKPDGSMVWEANEESQLVLMLCGATDKYESASSVYLCACDAHVCKCVKVGTLHGNFPPLKLLPPKLALTDGEVCAFDEYKCTEKIDVERLHKVLGKLREGHEQRKRAIAKLKAEITKLNGQGAESVLVRKREAETALKKLQRCEVVLSTAETLATMYSDLGPDSSGCVTHEVEYEQKGAALRGRLLAIGKEVHVRDSMFPRTATLQGMPNDLRRPLVGAFAHDVDCENSEVRLLCSVATQLNMTDLIPTLIKYRDNRSTWIEKLAGERLPRERAGCEAAG